MRIERPDAYVAAADAMAEKMKDTPILMSPPMVCATLLTVDPKSQTRRIVKSRKDHYIGCELAPHELAGEVNAGHYNNCPYGQPGDRLWVKETFFAYGVWEQRYSEDEACNRWHFVDMTLSSGARYQYDVPPDYKGHKRTHREPAWWKRPSIFMPRAACRILLEITAVRIEKLQDISEADAKAEGVQISHDRIFPYGYAYARLWEQINGPHSWIANPWVWVIEFKRVTP